jgi:hypothetical protein
VNAIGVTNNADVATITTAIQGPPNRSSNYPGVSPSPNVANVASTLPASLSTVSGLQNLVTTIKNNVTQPIITGPASSLASPGTQAAPQIIVVNGDLNLSGNTVGYGILVVTGTFTASGTVGWNGIVLVVGQGNFVASGTSTWNGAVVVAKTLDALGNPLATPAPGSVTVNINGGGNGGINYSSGCIAMANTLSTFHVVAIRELMN